MKDISKLWMKFDKSMAELLLEVVKGWTNPFEHGEPLIHISSYVEASHTVQNMTYLLRLLVLNK